MSFLALAAHSDHAELFSDTWNYSRTARVIDTTTKVEPILHLDMAIATLGDHEVGVTWKRMAGLTNATTLDEFNDVTPDLARQMWASLPTLGDREEVTLVHVGWSHRAAAFTATTFSSRFGFEPRPVVGLFVYPAPIGILPSDMELAGMAERLTGDGGLATLEAFAGFPATLPPTTTEEWVRLAMRARLDRACADQSTHMKVLLGGKLQRTVLHRGKVEQSVVHTFDDRVNRPEFQAAVAGTMHPRGQIQDCACGSGKTYRDCCIQTYIDDPCWCGSDKTMGNCCALPLDNVLLTAHRKDAP
ncbi:hypothetical protein DBB34_06540 [Sphaerisporangium cinnabarinum]|nr:SEC-C domain-containing protein [Sphaerisporangium cinnabarinum]PTU56965.1 hypothetical protein DBB34_06540 [Sphaerisporangium cinnabarinum]